MERVLELICQVGGIARVAPDEVFYDAGFSSMRALELLLALEDRFGISIPDQEFITARTAREMAALIQRLQQRQQTCSAP